MDQRRAQWADRSQFFAISARAMRRILVDHARQHLAGKRGGRRERVNLDEETLSLDQRADLLVAVDEALSTLGEVLTAFDRAPEAEPMLREALAVRGEKHGVEDPRTLETASLLGRCLAELGRYPEGEKLLLDSYRSLRANPYAGKELPGAARRLAEYYDLRGNSAAAGRVRAAGYAPSRRAS